MTERMRALIVLTAVSLEACGSGTLQPIQGASGTNDGGSTVTDSGAARDVSVRGDSRPPPPGEDAAPTEEGGTVARCKRGIATNAAPTAALSPSASQPGVSWWYNWAPKGSGSDAGLEFVPMIWGAMDLGNQVPSGSRFVLGFNEPNFVAQSDLTPTQAASDWPMVEVSAHATGATIVSPAVNFCGSPTDTPPCSDPSVTDPYTYLKDFLAACPSCEVDAIAVHWYNCDLPSLQAYLEGNLDAGGNLQGFVQFGKPIWVTEIACDGSHSVADQEAYMKAAVPYLEGNPHIFRYSWFSAGPIPNAELMTDAGVLTELGSLYVGLPQSCP